MGTFSDLFLLLAIGAVIGTWMKMTAARERAAREAARLCERYGLQLLDQSVGLRGLHIRHFGNRRALERCYSFEVSIDGQSRQPGRLWMAGDAITGYSLPTHDTRQIPGDHTLPIASAQTLGSNVIPLRPRLNPPPIVGAHPVRDPTEH
jgi:Protein of unknown function (DUF3301)